LPDEIQSLLDNGDVTVPDSQTVIVNDPRRKIGYVELGVIPQVAASLLRGCTVEYVGVLGDNSVYKITWSIEYANVNYSFEATAQSAEGSWTALTWGIKSDNTKTTKDILLYVPSGTKYFRWAAEGDNVP
jgi:hypothetical protein